MATITKEAEIEVIDGKPCKNGKPLWGAPLTIWQQQQEIRELKQILEGISDGNVSLAKDGTRIVGTFQGDFAPEFEPWQWTQGTKANPQAGVPCRWKHFHANKDEWEYRERLALWADSGYSEAIVERVIGMAANAFGGVIRGDGSGTLKLDVRQQRFGPVRTDRGHEGEQTFSMLPPFSPENELQVTVRIVRKEPGAAADIPPTG